MRDELIALASEAAEVLQAVANSGVSLPNNWRWPLIDELSGAAAIAAKINEGGDKPHVDPLVCGEPVLVVDCEPDYWSRGHHYKGSKPWVDPTKVWKLPIGTKLYTATPSQPVAQMDTSKSCLPDGWVAVPREPTEAMWEATHECSTYVAFDRFCVDYALMLAAAPNLSDSVEVPRG